MSLLRHVFISNSPENIIIRSLKASSIFNGTFRNFCSINNKISDERTLTKEIVSVSNYSETSKLCDCVLGECKRKENIESLSKFKDKSDRFQSPFLIGNIF